MGEVSLEKAAGTPGWSLMHLLLTYALMCMCILLSSADSRQGPNLGQVLVSAFDRLRIYIWVIDISTSSTRQGLYFYPSYLHSYPQSCSKLTDTSLEKNEARNLNPSSSDLGLCCLPDWLDLQLWLFLFLFFLPNLHLSSSDSSQLWHLGSDFPPATDHCLDPSLDPGPSGPSPVPTVLRPPRSLKTEHLGRKIDSREGVEKKVFEVRMTSIASDAFQPPSKWYAGESLIEVAARE